MGGVLSSRGRAAVVGAAAIVGKSHLPSVAQCIDPILHHPLPTVVAGAHPAAPHPVILVAYLRKRKVIPPVTMDNLGKLAKDSETVALKKAAQLRTELEDMTPRELKQRARSLGAEQAAIDELDDAHNVKAAAIELVHKFELAATEETA